MIVRSLAVVLATALFACEPPAPVDVRVATWNLRNFGVAGSDASRQAELIASLGPAVLALQEVVTQEAFDDLVSRLPDHQGHLAAAASTGGGLRMGFIWDTTRVQLRELVEPMVVNGDLFPRPPLQAVVDLVEESAPVASFIAVNVHLKAGADADDEDRRVRALAQLETHVRSLVEGGTDDEVLLLGDFNEAATDPRFSEAFSPFTGDADLYRALTLEQAQAGAFTFLPVPLFFDHMVATAGLDEERGASAPVIQRYDESVADYRDAISDHLPVVLDLTVEQAQ